MDLGLGTLAELKANCLIAGWATETAFDTVLESTGKGAAAAFERYCNRKFPRLAGAVFEADADRSVVILDRYPVEQITAFEIRFSLLNGWEAQAVAAIFNLAENSGKVDFGFVIGDCNARVRITFDGGWWYDTTEDASGTQPAGTTALPDDVKQAWYLQVQHVLEQTEATQGRASGDRKIAPAKLELLPLVKEMLNPHRRFAS